MFSRVFVCPPGISGPMSFPARVGISGTSSLPGVCGGVGMKGVGMPPPPSGHGKLLECFLFPKCFHRTTNAFH